MKNYRNGIAVPLSPADAAVKAQQDQKTAQNNLNWALHHQHMLLCAAPQKQSIEIDKRLLTRANSGDCNASYEIGKIYERAGGKAHLDVATSWYGKAAEQGHATAAQDLATIENKLRDTVYRPSTDLSRYMP